MIQANVLSLTPEQVERKRIANENRRIGFTCGAFDVMHAGHDLMLAEARSMCQFLRVGLQSDPTLDRPEKNSPVQALEERLIQLSSNRYVDEVIVYATEADLCQYLEAHMRANGGDIDVRIVGADHEGKPFTGDDLPIDIRFNSRNHGYSSTYLRERIYLAEKAKQEKAEREAAMAAN
jgi:glycerol-3-phosphate cytidylyltransferase